MRISEEIEQIIKIKTLGSSELVDQLNELFKAMPNKRKTIENSLPKVKKHLGHFATITDYLNKLESILSEKDAHKLLEFLNSYPKSETVKYEKIFNKLYKKLPIAKSIITISRSGTLLNIFKLWHKKNKNLKIIICESRPMLEGRLLAEDLLTSGIKVEIITDSMMSLFVPKVDAAIIGADSILKNKNVVNKVGSKALALLCKEYIKPFYVVTTRSKYSNRKIFKPKKEHPSEVWRKKGKNLTVSNIYFEEIEKKLITQIISE
jgi:translation initiation factor eIF-2B subunit delta